MKNTQPTETIGKVIAYFCNGRWHHPFFADRLNWSNLTASGAISESGVIKHYKILKCPAAFLRKLRADEGVMFNKSQNE